MRKNIDNTTAYLFEKLLSNSFWVGIFLILENIILFNVIWFVFVMSFEKRLCKSWSVLGLVPPELLFENIVTRRFLQLNMMKNQIKKFN